MPLKIDLISPPDNSSGGEIIFINTGFQLLYSTMESINRQCFTAS